MSFGLSMNFKSKMLTTSLLQIMCRNSNFTDRAKSPTVLEGYCHQGDKLYTVAPSDPRQGFELFYNPISTNKIIFFFC